MANTASFRVTGDIKINCPSCEQRIINALRRIPGIEAVRASANTQLIEIDFEQLRLGLDELKAKLEQLGYSVIFEGGQTAPSSAPSTHDAVSGMVRPGASVPMYGLQKLRLRLGGMHCSLCTESIRKTLMRLDGVLSTQVSIAHEEALVQYDPRRVSPPAIRKALEDIGFTVREPDLAEIFAEEERELAMARRKAFIAGGLLAGSSALMLLMLFKGPMLSLAVLMGVLAFVTFLGPARFIIFRNGWQSIRRGILNQDVLVSASSIGGLVGGVAGLFFPAFPAGGFFGATIFVLSFHLIGGYASVLVHVRASQSVRRLLALEPKTARRVKGDGTEEMIPLESLAVDDRVRVIPGERIPTDGVVVEGASAVDESMVTGEPIPQDKLQGDRVTGGSLNRMGSLVLRVTRTGEDTFLRTVARHVAEARAMKPGILRLVDRVLLVYVPLVFGSSAFGLLFWSLGAWVFVGGPLMLRASFAALSALIMGYPCALGMATPLAIIRASGEAAERGILMRSGEAFHIFKDVKTVVFDKTGTLTEGKPHLADCLVKDGSSDEVLRLAASVEALSEHPLAQAIVDAAKERALTLAGPADFEARPGRGVLATVEGHRVIVGTERLLKDEGIDASPVQPLRERVQSGGQTGVLVAIDGRAAGVLALSDRLKTDAGETIEALHKMGLEPILITGDNIRTARAVASALNIERVIAELLPEDKATEIRKLQQKEKVAMVGDGINDAPALMQSDVGIAIGAGTDIAIESADVVLISERLRTLVEALVLARTSYRLTAVNVGLALSFNGVGVLAAITGLLHPVWAMLAMAVSVSVVLINSFSSHLLAVNPSTLKKGKK